MQVSSVRNPQGFWINTDVFREEALHYDKYKYYCPDPWGSPAWEQYWSEQQRRCREGYTIGGVRITGHHYFYLNFCEISVAEELSESVGKKKQKFPDFWDGDYNYFHSLEIARYGMDLDVMKGLNLSLEPHPDYLDGGYNMIVGKARRKGYSFKNGAICANLYNNERNAQIVIGAFEKKHLYPTGTMQMATNYINTLNERTGWAKAREYVDKIDHKRASYKETINGIGIERGYMSEIFALTFQDNDDAARGKDPILVLFEEAGHFPNLTAAYKATAPGLRAGKYATGQIIIFGTGGDMESGTRDFAEMFYSPAVHKLMPFVNIWDKDAENTKCGFFHPFFWNLEGFYDKQGNSDVVKATAWEDKERADILGESSGTSVLQGRVQEYPKNPSEAFLTVSINDFPVIELRNRLNKVIREKIHLKKGQPVHLYTESDEKGRLKVRAKPDLENKLNPIWDYSPKITDLSGCVIMYEHPIDKPPPGMYSIGFDPYRQVMGQSLASITVYKGNHKFSYTRNTIVAEFVGRPRDPDDVNKIAWMLAELYNTQVMHENEVTHVSAWFTKNHKERWLAMQPDRVISANIKQSTVARVFGCHMVEKLKDGGEKYIKSYLLGERDFDEYGGKILNLDTINNPALLEELISYNRKGNFDRVMSLMMTLFQVEEEDLGKEYDGENSKAEELKEEMADYIASMYARN